MSVDLLVQKIKEKGNPSVAGLDRKSNMSGVYQKKSICRIRTEFKGCRTEAIWEFNKGSYRRTL